MVLIRSIRCKPNNPFSPKNEQMTNSIYPELHSYNHYPYSAQHLIQKTNAEDAINCQEVKSAEET